MIQKYRRVQCRVNQSKLKTQNRSKISALITSIAVGESHGLNIVCLRLQRLSCGSTKHITLHFHRAPSPVTQFTLFFLSLPSLTFYVALPPSCARFCDTRISSVYFTYIHTYILYWLSSWRLFKDNNSINYTQLKRQKFTTIKNLLQGRLKYLQQYLSGV